MNERERCKESRVELEVGWMMFAAGKSKSSALDLHTAFNKVLPMHRVRNCSFEGVTW
jgi:hypothetical protein